MNIARSAGSDGYLQFIRSGVDPRRVSTFSFENFQVRGWERWRCTLSNRQIVHRRPGLNSKPFRSMYVEKVQSRPVDSDSSVGRGRYAWSPLGAFREEQAMIRHRVSPSHPNLNFLQYTIQILVPYIMWSAQAVSDSKIDYTQRHLFALRGTQSA